MSTKLWEHLENILKAIGGTPVPASDGAANPTAGTVGANMNGFNGATWDRMRLPTKIVNVSNVAVGATATLWTPAAGKKFRLMGGQFSVNQASGYMTFKDGSGTVMGGISPILDSNSKYAFDWGNGVLSDYANNPLKGQFSVTGAVMTGYLYGTEE